MAQGRRVLSAGGTGMRRLGSILTGACLLAAGSLGCSVGFVKPAEALAVFDVELVCPIDGAKFSTQIIAAYRTTGIRLDLKPVGDVIAPYPYPVCPGNGFVIYQDKFSSDELAALKAIVASADYRRARGEHTDRYMVAYMKERLGTTRFELGHLYLQASWEAERGKPAMLDHYRAIALENLDGHLMQNRDLSTDWWTAAILTAELERLLGHFEAAEARLDKLPMGLIATSGLDEAFLKSVVDEIRFYARARNSQPQELREKFIGASVDFVITLALGGPDPGP